MTIESGCCFIFCCWWLPEHSRVVDHVTSCYRIRPVAANVQRLQGEIVNGLLSDLHPHVWLDLHPNLACPRSLLMATSAFPFIPSGRLPVSVQVIVVRSNTCEPGRSGWEHLWQSSKDKNNPSKGPCTTTHMGQFLQGGKNGRLMSFFFKSRASVWPNLMR